MKTKAFDEIAREVATDLRDACMVCVVEADALVGKSVFRTREPQAGYLADLSPFHYLLGQRLPGRVWQSDTSILIPEVDTEGISEGARPEVVKNIHQLHVASLMAAPVRSGGKVVGVLLLTRNEKGDPYDEADLARLEAWAEKVSFRLAGEPGLAPAVPAASAARARPPKRS